MTNTVKYTLDIDMANKDVLDIIGIQLVTENTYYYRPYDMARAIALTEFLRELEIEHGDKFKILKAHPMWLINSHDRKTDPVFTIGLWASFMIDDVEYYIQMDQNQFFDAYFSRSWPIGRDKKRCEYLTRMNEDMLAFTHDCFDCKPETIRQLVKNFHATLALVNCRIPDTYIKDVPSYERLGPTQTLYLRKYGGEI